MNDQQSAGETQAQATGETPTFDTWLAGQGDDVKLLYEGHVRGLKTALERERADRKDFEVKLREAAAALQKGSEERTRLETLAKHAETASKRADFMVAAHAAGVNDLELAWVVVEQKGLWTRRGEPDVEALRAAHPTLFMARSAAAGNAGSGTGAQPPKSAGMNDYIRAAARW